MITSKDSSDTWFDHGTLFYQCETPSNLSAKPSQLVSPHNGQDTNWAALRSGMIMKDCSALLDGELI